MKRRFRSLARVLTLTAAIAARTPCDSPAATGLGHSNIAIDCARLSQSSNDNPFVENLPSIDVSESFVKLSALQQLIKRQPLSLAHSLNELTTADYLSRFEEMAFRRYAALHWYGLWTKEQRAAYSRAYLDPATYRSLAEVYGPQGNLQISHLIRCIVGVPMPNKTNARIEILFRDVPFDFPLSVTFNGNTVSTFDPALSRALASLFREPTLRDRLSGVSWPLFLSGWAGDALTESLRRPSREPQAVIDAALGSNSGIRFWALDFYLGHNVRWLMLLHYSGDINMAALVTGLVNDNSLHVSNQDRRDAETALSRVADLHVLVSHLESSDETRIFPLSYYDKGSAEVEFLRDATAQRFPPSDLRTGVKGASVIEVDYKSSLAVLLLLKDGRLIFWKYLNVPPQWITIGPGMTCDSGEVCAISDVSHR